MAVLVMVAKLLFIPSPSFTQAITNHIRTNRIKLVADRSLIAEMPNTITAATPMRGAFSLLTGHGYLKTSQAIEAAIKEFGVG